MSTESVDPSKGELVLRVELRPDRGLTGPDGASVNRPVSLDVIGGTGRASYRYVPGDVITPVDVPIGLDGNEDSYPFDRYRAVFAIVATASGAEQPASASSPTAPTHLSFVGSLKGYRESIRPVPSPLGGADATYLALSISRAPLTPTFALLILVLEALVATAVAALAIILWRHQRRVEPPMLTFLAALLFALIPLRNAMPDAPPIGALVDVAVFFWAVTIVAVSLISVLTLWIRRRHTGP